MSLHNVVVDPWLLHSSLLLLLKKMVGKLARVSMESWGLVFIEARNLISLESGLSHV